MGVKSVGGVLRVFVQPQVEGHVGQTTHHQGVTIGRSVGHKLRAHQGARTSAVFDHDGLAQLLAQPLGDQTTNHVITPTRCGGHNDANGFAWVGGLRQHRRGPRGRGQTSGQDQTAIQWFHTNYLYRCPGDQNQAAPPHRPLGHSMGRSASLG